MTNQKHYPDLGRMCHQYGISARVSQASFGRETSGIIAKCRMFSQASSLVAIVVVEWLQYYRELTKSVKCVNSLPGQEKVYNGERWPWQRFN